MAEVVPVPSAEGRGAFAGFIGPRTLVGQVAATAPWLFDAALEAPLAAPGARLSESCAGPRGFLTVLRAAERLEPRAEPSPAERTDYFALCLAAHFASAATWVPTDVDTKIRRALWQEAVRTDELPRMRALALGLAQWDARLVSARVVGVAGAGDVSGHDGERLSVLCGGLVASRAARDAAGEGELRAAIDAELGREARAFLALAREPGFELDTLRLAAVLTHNAGDVMQGLADSAVGAEFAELARERLDRYGGAFALAAALYRERLAAEGHRNYPLRKPRALRRERSLLLPIAPFLDDWGERVARAPGLDDEARAEIVAALVEGQRKVAGQVGYARALAGFAAAFPRGLEAPELARHYPASIKRELRSADLRRALAVRRESFEASAVKAVRTLVDRSRA